MLAVFRYAHLNLFFDLNQLKVKFFNLLFEGLCHNFSLLGAFVILATCDLIQQKSILSCFLMFLSISNSGMRMTCSWATAFFAISVFVDVAFSECSSIFSVRNLTIIMTGFKTFWANCVVFRVRPLLSNNLKLSNLLQLLF